MENKFGRITAVNFGFDSGSIFRKNRVVQFVGLQEAVPNIFCIVSAAILAGKTCKVPARTTVTTDQFFRTDGESNDYTRRTNSFKQQEKGKQCDYKLLL